MPYSLSDAPPNIPGAELIESLLCKRAEGCKTRPLQELTEAERNKTNVVQVGLGKKPLPIEGDPYGVWYARAGNVCHWKDGRMASILVDVLGPIFDTITAAKIQDSTEITLLRRLLERIPCTDAWLLGKELADGQPPTIDCSDPNQVTVRFRYGPRTVRLVQCLDLNVEDRKTYKASTRAKQFAKLVEERVGESEMPVPVQKYLMARIHAERREDLHVKDAVDNLRALAREQYWLGMSKEQRAQVREAALQLDPNSNPEDSFADIEANWKAKWDNGRYDPDYVRNYLADQIIAANEVWPMVDADIFIVTDVNRRVVFANIEKLTQILFGDGLVQLMDRAIDLWSFYQPLPQPESRRQVMEHHVRRLHPELDPSKATVESLQNAKMAVAHYGCWSKQGDPHGKKVSLTKDTRRAKTGDTDLLRDMFSRFAKAVLGKTSEIIRFLVKPLDEGYYRECVEVLENLPVLAKLSVDSEEDWISLFALGINSYTQRHTDSNDIKGGLAGLCGNLCLPQLGFKVPYLAGSCVILRGCELEHLVQDFSGPRFFVIGTNHESCKLYAMRKLGRMPPLRDPPERRSSKKTRRTSRTVSSKKRR